jgi:hypothetical protein
MEFGDYIVYVDESGDHGLISIDPEFPVFVLAFCIFEKQHYLESVVPAAQRIKFVHFGHDHVIFHEREIRKREPPFEFLKNRDRCNLFMKDLDQLMEKASFTLIAAIIDKNALKEKYKEPKNPYEIALCFCMERLYMFLEKKGQRGRKTFLIVESRGHVEDRALDLAFRRIAAGANYCGPMPEFEIVFADKRCNAVGLQIADLLVRPIGRNVLNPEQPNRAYEVLKKKFLRNADGKIDGVGRKLFPA